jgi:hypothetical protein
VNKVGGFEHLEKVLRVVLIIAGLAVLVFFSLMMFGLG